MNKRQYKKHRFVNMKRRNGLILGFRRYFKFKYNAWRKRRWIWLNVYRKGKDQLCKFRPEKVKGE